jgi:putative DNA primase/helicase
MNKFSEDALALLFAERYAGEVRYCSASSSRHKWHVLTNGEWEIDYTLHVFDLVRGICRAAAANCKDPALARQLTSAETVTAVEKMARSDRRIAVTRQMLGIVPKRGKKEEV